MRAKALPTNTSARSVIDGMLDLPSGAPPMIPRLLHHGSRQGPQLLLVHQFDRAFVRLGDRLEQTGVLFQTAPRLRIHPAVRIASPGQRPLHTMVPTYLTKAGRSVMRRGDRQTVPADHNSVVTNILDYGCDMQRGDRRAAASLRGPVAARGPRASRIVEGLKKLGHKTTSRQPARRRPGDLDQAGQGHAHAAARRREAGCRSSRYSGPRAGSSSIRCARRLRLGQKVLQRFSARSSAVVGACNHVVASESIRFTTASPSPQENP